MESVLIVGIDTETGAHLAAELKNQFRVLGLTLASRPTGAKLDSFELCSLASTTPDALLRHQAIDRVIYCGDAAESCWASDDMEIADFDETNRWALACHAAQTPFLLISSDAVFTGPWMFHSEDDDCFCPSFRSISIRNQETRILSVCPTATVVRTITIGWGPESLLSELLFPQTETEHIFASHPHATPIYTGLFAKFVKRLIQTDFRGLIHLAGAERVSPYHFALQLCERFERSQPEGQRISGLTQPASGFGQGETCLQTSLARKTLGCGLPTLTDSLDAIEADLENGLAEQLSGRHLSRLSRVA